MARLLTKIVRHTKRLFEWVTRADKGELGKKMEHEKMESIAFQ